jgi:hypothetical protein
MGLEQDSLEQLYMKRGILEMILQEEVPKSEDKLFLKTLSAEKKQKLFNGIREVKRQLTIINAEIKRREKTERPPDLTVGLKSLNLKVDAKK